MIGEEQALTRLKHKIHAFERTRFPGARDDAVMNVPEYKDSHRELPAGPECGNQLHLQSAKSTAFEAV